MWANRPCLVTGGAGFGGSHLSRLLLDDIGARVYVLDLKMPRNSYLRMSHVADRVEFLQGDVRDLDATLLWLKRFQIKTIFHLAAQPIVPLSKVAPLETLSVNALGTYTLLEATRRSDFVEEFVLASSGAYYGTTFSNAPVPEDAPPLPAANLYGPSKVAADIATRCYAETYGINAGVCRFSNTYGPGDTNFSRIIPGAIHHLLSNEPYEFGDRDDGSTVLDYMHVADMARAYVAVAEKATQYRGEAFNFGAGTARSTRQVAEAVSLAYDGQTREPRFSGSPQRRPIVKTLDASKAVAKLSWKAHYDDFDSGVKETMDWYREHWNLI